MLTIGRQGGVLLPQMHKAVTLEDHVIHIKGKALTFS